MLGALIGDIVGSRFEFKDFKCYDFAFFTDANKPTDDSLMTLAIAKALLNSHLDESILGELTEKYMHQIARKHPNVGWGYRFYRWVFELDSERPNSFGNGAFPMVAVTKSMTNHELQFKNVLGAMKLQLKGTLVVKSIKVEGRNGERLCGAATVTAYTNNLTPAITMTGTDEASKSVTLDCGDGVQLNTSSATDFIISLPPVLFQNGFTVIVTDVEEKEYTVTATDANTVLRSAILVMPEVLFEDSGEGAPEEDEEDLVIPVLSVSLNSTSLKLYEGDSAQLEATVRPTDATNRTVVWSSGNPVIATVDQSGLVTAVSEGTTTLYAVAGGKTATVIVKVSAATLDYIDEYGINHGPGVEIHGVVWAPVNCGYHATDYQWGKLYQWGRKYGQGYSGKLYDEYVDEIGEVTDATTPYISDGPVSLQDGQSVKNKNVFFTCHGDPYDWLYPQDDMLWNSGSEVSPVKTEYDPCPDGWRVPTYKELSELCRNRSPWTTDDADQVGYWFSGSLSYSSKAAQVFIPAAGCRYNNGDAVVRGFYGGYWSSRPRNDYDFGAYCLEFNNSIAEMSDNVICPNANGCSVRCVQD